MFRALHNCTTGRMFKAAQHLQPWPNVFTVSRSLTLNPGDDRIFYWESSRKERSFHGYSYGASTTSAFTFVYQVGSWRSTGHHCR